MSCDLFRLQADIPSLFDLTLEYIVNNLNILGQRHFLGYLLSSPVLCALVTRLKERNLFDDKNLALIFRPLAHLAPDAITGTLPLASLNLSDLPFLSDKYISQLLITTGSHLHSLSLDSCYGFSSQSLETLLRYCTNIVHLNLHGCSLINDEKIDQICQRLSKLKYLTLGTSRKRVIRKVWISFNNDQSIDRTFEMTCYPSISITDRALHCVAQHCKQLKSLNLAGVPHITAAGVNALANNFFLSSQLVELNLNYCPHIRRHCEFLTGLTNLSAFHSVTADDGNEILTTLIKHHPKIRALSLRLSSSDVHEVTSLCLLTNLQSLHLCCPIRELNEDAMTFLLDWALSHVTSFSFDSIAWRFPSQLFQRDLRTSFHQLVCLDVYCPFPVEASCSLLLAAPHLRTLKLVVFEQPDYFFHELCCSRFGHCSNRSVDVDEETKRRKKQKLDIDKRENSDNHTNCVHNEAFVHISLQILKLKIGSPYGSKIIKNVAKLFPNLTQLEVVPFALPASHPPIDSSLKEQQALVLLFQLCPRLTKVNLHMEKKAIPHIRPFLRRLHKWKFTDLFVVQQIPKIFRTLFSIRYCFQWTIS